MYSFSFFTCTDFSRSNYNSVMGGFGSSTFCHHLPLLKKENHYMDIGKGGYEDKVEEARFKTFF